MADFHTVYSPTLNIYTTNRCINLYFMQFTWSRMEKKTQRQCWVPHDIEHMLLTPYTNIVLAIFFSRLFCCWYILFIFRVTFVDVYYAFILINIGSCLRRNKKKSAMFVTFNRLQRNINNKQEQVALAGAAAAAGTYWCINMIVACLSM